MTTPTIITILATACAILATACAILAYALLCVESERRRGVDTEAATYARMLRYRNERDAARQGWAKYVARAAREENDREQAQMDPPPMQGVLTEKMRMRFRIWPN